MQKWGNRFILPYEMLTGGQGLRINKLAAMIQLDAATEQTRQFDELIETLEDGDGVTGCSNGRRHYNVWRNCKQFRVYRVFKLA